MRTLGTLATALLLTVPVVAADDDPQATVTVTVEATVRAPVGEAMTYVPEPERGLRTSEINVTSDLAGAELSGKQRIEGTAKAMRGHKLTHVGVWVDGWYMGTARGTERWSFELDTALLLDGDHTFHAVAFTIPKAALFFVATGTGTSLRFSSLNHVEGVVLFEKTMDFTGVATETWLLRLGQDYTGLRVTLATEPLPNGTLPAPLAQLAVAYKETEDDKRAPLRTWLATYGPLQGGAVVSRPPHPVMEAPGVLTLAGVVAGEGRVHVKVEAVPLAR